tara:strand:- start:647 stop:1468 length:822 start_codon:yes stop_codon:yes gene_type:complete
METINCQICSSNSYKEYLSVKDRFNISKNYFQLVKCECGFIYLNPRPDEEEISKYYSSKAYSPHSNTSIFYKTAQSFSFRWKFKLINRYVGKNKQILDYGSGKGEFGDYLDKKGFNVNNYEPILDSFNSLIDNKKYDIITLWHSLEHIHDLPKALDCIYKALDNKGYVFFAIPNIDAVEKGFFDKDWVAYDAPRHLYHFNEKSLNKLLSKHKFKIIESKSIFQDTFYNIYLSIQSKNFVLKLFKFIYISFISFFTILFNNNKSSSKLYICIKN